MDPNLVPKLNCNPKPFSPMQTKVSRQTSDGKAGSLACQGWEWQARLPAIAQSLRGFAQGPSYSCCGAGRAAGSPVRGAQPTARSAWLARGLAGFPLPPSTSTVVLPAARFLPLDEMQPAVVPAVLLTTCFPPSCKLLASCHLPRSSLRWCLLCS